jgi:phosphomannomutase
LAGALMASELLRAEAPGRAVLYDVRATRALAELIREQGGRPVQTRVGHSHIKAGLRREQAVMAAELSGHYYFRDFFSSDDGEAAMFLILSLLSRDARPASQVVAPLRRYHHSGEVNFHVADANETMAKVEAELRGRAKEVSHVDGVSMDFDTWWLNLRPSNTEPVVRLNLESLRSREEMEERKAEVVRIIKGG